MDLLLSYPFTEYFYRNTNIIHFLTTHEFYKHPVYVKASAITNKVFLKM